MLTAAEAKGACLPLTEVDEVLPGDVLISPKVCRQVLHNGGGVRLDLQLGRCARQTEARMVSSLRQDTLSTGCQKSDIVLCSVKRMAINGCQIPSQNPLGYA